MIRVKVGVVLTSVGFEVVVAIGPRREADSDTLAARAHLRDVVGAAHRTAATAVEDVATRGSLAAVGAQITIAVRKTRLASASARTAIAIYSLHVVGAARRAASATVVRVVCDL